MLKAFVLTKRELRQSFTTPMAYVVIVGFLILSGFFFFSLLRRYGELTSQALYYPGFSPSLNSLVVIPYYRTLEIILLFITPVLSMGLISEERRSGTFELLVTAPISSLGIVVGKFLSIAIISSFMLLLSSVYPMTLVYVADPEVPPIAVGIVGIWLFTLSCISLGLGISSFMHNQTLAGFVILVFLLLLYVIDAQAALFSSYFGADFGAILRYLSPAEHLDLFLKGVITSRDLVYFATLIIVGLSVAVRSVESEWWR